MVDTPQNAPDSEQPNIDTDKILQQLRRKEGSWVEWGQLCQTLQKAGYSSQTIFEETGFEPIHQNQVIVAAQVYNTVVAIGVPEAVKNHFERKGSDVLYELRILSQTERAAVAALSLEKSLDFEEAREAAKAVKDFSRLGSIPEGFTNHPGDAIAYQFWRQARQKSDLQERSRLIAKGLRFAHSDTARQQIEKLLTDFTIVKAKAAPLLPLYRLEADEYLPRALPVVGKLPLTRSDLQAVPFVEEIEPFGMVQFAGASAWVPVPGWQVVRLAEDPVAILCSSNAFPTPLPGQVEDVLVIIDRAQRDWEANGYFLVEQDDTLQIQWFEETPSLALLGRVILIMRPKKVLDEDYTKDPWQMDE
ncbi:MAG: RuBisCO accumulation factor 1 [Leptolyngbyaceae cyanobacterium bins.302]|nr:RuBisCO accumulation factor 1 [Leptolyngbyaceae cyanobacterium bins.302]